MPQALRTALQETLANWPDDLPDAWWAALGDVKLDFDGVDAALELQAWEPIFPARKGRSLAGSPKGAHMLKAFDSVMPAQVRCVVLGQDPYPSIDIATGRAFEVGNVAEWRELDKMFTKSIRAWVQMLAEARTGDAAYGGSFDNWPRTLRAIETGALPFETPATLCDRWTDSGVLLLNTSFTLSRFQVAIDPHQSHGHLVLWKPLIQAVLAYLLQRGEPVVLMGFGASAAEAFEAAGIAEGLHGKVACILREHPAYADAVLGLPNPFALCNAHLAQMACEPIDW
ncbi:hypothetical protein QTI51_11825 [Variovorax sp. J22G73]|jgi:uracil-DNA glycosylase|uniref:hypothetical protein n=1 Tax=unclassified Variovorax TaxID=663243 RepID=UPI000D5F21AC|nr:MULTISPECIES: hypothetical protein [unclassified Variovorax]MDM0006010.1 hypothetical protein [Variovorax sp. J22R203]MDM0097966.1 hypothetical protein [Variovorax sp. J22G73]